MKYLLARELIGYALYVEEEAEKRKQKGYQYPRREKDIIYEFCVSEFSLALILLLRHANLGSGIEIEIENLSSSESKIAKTLTKMYNSGMLLKEEF